MGRLDGKVVLITGVASGIGLATARLFHQEGAVIFGVDRDAKAGMKLTQEFAAKRWTFHSADLTTEAACQSTIEQCHNTYGRIDVLYNNAGIASYAPFLEIEASALENVFAVNFMSVFYLCQQVIPKMLAQGEGRIINTTSELAIVAQPLYTAYCATKGAVMSFTRALALEYAQSNLQINMVCPGPIETPLLQTEFDAATDPKAAFDAGIATMPIGRYGQPEEVAKVTLFLASDAPQLMQGTAIVVDGAKTIL
ncbi:SDR family oxidoreductase [filamentous cyanobacterium LEGE 11480]|uniref:SDR family oxidoreductase n=1 Tax=Romeriopsis navalis LEGE 11480 TaxID=2777977 RepID=A0A928VTI7_9CYAN|nr:SDR family oxidoreductase [Romeriopsis navalis]MBE9031964.1 SDR family oxidoreductase [Romeriopsis navalis LEGE 11480]